MPCARRNSRADTQQAVFEAHQCCHSTHRALRESCGTCFACLPKHAGIWVRARSARAMADEPQMPCLENGFIDPKTGRRNSSAYYAYLKAQKAAGGSDATKARPTPTTTSSARAPAPRAPAVLELASIFRSFRFQRALSLFFLLLLLSLLSSFPEN